MDNKHFTTEADLYRWLTRGYDPLNIGQDELARRCDSDMLENGLLLLDYLVMLGMAQRTAEGYVVSDPSAARAVLVLEPTEEELAAQQSDQSMVALQPGDLVVSVPLSLRPQLGYVRAQHMGVRIWNLQEAFGALLDEARQEILLTLPFLEPDGLGFCIERIASAGQRGIPLRILGRGVIRAEQHVHPFRHAERRRAFAKIVDAYIGGGGAPDEVQIRDFGKALVASGDAGPVHYEGIHQKIVVIDRRLSYTGSGELRLASFVSNGEAGQIHGAAASAFWAGFFWMFWERAEPVVL